MKLLSILFFSSNRATHQNNYNEVRQTDDYSDYEEEEGEEVGGDPYSYDNLNMTHLADYLETASTAKRSSNPTLSLAALVLLVFLAETEAVF